MATLVRTTVFIDLTLASADSLGFLPPVLHPQSKVKKGHLDSLDQRLADGTIVRHYRNIGAAAVRTTEGEKDFSQLFVDFEVYADGWGTLGENAGVDYALYLDQQLLEGVRQGRMYMPHCYVWYPNRYVYRIPNHAFEATNRFEFIANADSMHRC